MALESDGQDQFTPAAAAHVIRRALSDHDALRDLIEGPINVGK